jgi:hypothetical protein
MPTVTSVADMSTFLFTVLSRYVQLALGRFDEIKADPAHATEEDEVGGIYWRGFISLEEVSHEHEDKLQPVFDDMLARALSTKWPLEYNRPLPLTQSQLTAELLICSNLDCPTPWKKHRFFQESHVFCSVRCRCAFTGDDYEDMVGDDE